MPLNDGKKPPPISAANSPLKASSKALNTETSKAAGEQSQKQEDAAKNNNKAAASNVNESDDDDSVFINENKPKKASKHQPALGNASSVMLSVAPSSTKPIATAAAQIHNSRESNVPSETVVR